MYIKRMNYLLTLSRNDVFDHIKAMGNNPVFPVSPNFREKFNIKLPDYLMCGERCFGLMFGRVGVVFSFILYMSGETAKRCGGRHTVFRPDFPRGRNWYGLTADQTYRNKHEIYQILDECYDFTFKEFYGENNTCDAEAAKTGRAAIEKEARMCAKYINEKLIKAEYAYRAALEEFKAVNYTGFTITRKEIAGHIRELNDPRITVSGHCEKSLQPVSIKYKDKAYAMLYETETAAFMTARIADAYADGLSLSHPEIRRAEYPKKPGWYYIPLDGAFDGKESVYRVLKAAQIFAENNRFQ